MAVQLVWHRTFTCCYESDESEKLGVVQFVYQFQCLAETMYVTYLMLLSCTGMWHIFTLYASRQPGGVTDFPKSCVAAEEDTVSPQSRCYRRVMNHVVLENLELHSCLSVRGFAWMCYAHQQKASVKQEFQFNDQEAWSCHVGTMLRIIAKYVNYSQSIHLWADVIFKGTCKSYQYEENTGSKWDLRDWSPLAQPESGWYIHLGRILMMTLKFSVPFGKPRSLMSVDQAELGLNRLLNMFGCLKVGLLMQDFWVWNTPDFEKNGDMPTGL